MGLESLYLFTMLGGMAAGAYAFDAGLRRTREGSRPWLVPLVVVALFAVGMIAATTHVHSIPRAVESVFGGTVNFILVRTPGKADIVPISAEALHPMILNL